MKLSTMPLALAVAVGLASTAAHAQLATPTIGTAAPSLTGLYVSIWDSSSQHSELVNLSYQYSDLLPSTGNLSPNSATGAYVTAANPTGAAGSVLQLNFGVLPSFTSTFGTPSSTTSYMVLAANAQSGVDFTATPTTAATLTSSSLSTLATNAGAEVANWQQAPTVATSGTAIDLTGTATYSSIAGPNSSGSNGLSGFNFSGTVGTALDFFNLVPGSKRGSVALTTYANDNGDGFWFLSSTGDLTYNVLAGSTSPVPLPAAVWLLVSGLAGLGAIGRRRNVAAV
jgi:hypothetical protein